MGFKEKFEENLLEIYGNEDFDFLDFSEVGEVIKKRVTNIFLPFSDYFRKLEFKKYEIKSNSKNEEDTELDRIEKEINYLTSKMVPNKALSMKASALLDYLKIETEKIEKELTVDRVEKDEVKLSLLRNTLCYLIPFNIANNKPFDENYYLSGELNESDFNTFVIKPFIIMKELSYNNLNRIYVKGKKQSLEDIFLNSIKIYLDNILKNEDQVLINELFRDLVTPYKSYGDLEVISIDRHLDDFKVLFIFDEYFDELKDYIVRFIISLDKNLKTKLNNNLKNVFEHESLFIFLENLNIIKNKTKENDIKINSETKSNNYNKKLKSIKHDSLKSFLINNDFENKGYYISKTRNFVIFNYMTNFSEFKNKNFKPFHLILEKYFYDPSELNEKEFLIKEIIFKSVFFNTINRLNETFNKYDKGLNNLLTKEEIKDLRNYCITLNCNTPINKNPLNVLSFKVGDITSRIMNNESFENVRKIERMNNVFKKISYRNKHISNSKVHSDLESYFESVFAIDELNNIGIKIKEPDLKRVEKEIDKLIENINSKINGNRSRFEKFSLQLSFNGLNLETIEFKDFLESMVKYLKDRNFEGVAELLNKRYKNYIISKTFK